MSAAQRLLEMLREADEAPTEIVYLAAVLFSPPGVRPRRPSCLAWIEIEGSTGGAIDLDPERRCNRPIGHDGRCQWIARYADRGHTTEWR